MRQILLSGSVLLGLNVLACAPKRTQLSDSSAESLRAGLPIVGTWVAELYQGYFYDAPSERKTVRLEGRELRPELWQMESNLDASGQGYLKTMIECKSGPAKAETAVSVIPAPRGVLLFPSALDMRNCDLGKQVETHERINIYSIRETNLPRNLGLDGKIDSLVKNCSKLRGHRYINSMAVNPRIGASGCIGFSDAEANKLSLLLVPRAEVHAIRVDFKRIR
ncbi:MAG: hypothetical protein RLZZ488_76 [Pseudomonadota bacterium]|jgi:hypothetical protein